MALLPERNDHLWYCQTLCTDCHEPVPRLLFQNTDKAYICEKCHRRAHRTLPRPYKIPVTYPKDLIALRSVTTVAETTFFGASGKQDPHGLGQFGVFYHGAKK